MIRQAGLDLRRALQKRGDKVYINVNTKEEGRLLTEVCDDFRKFGETKITCPRCGNEFISERNGWLIRCKTENCMAYLHGGYYGEDTDTEEPEWYKDMTEEDLDRMLQIFEREAPSKH